MLNFLQTILNKGQGFDNFQGFIWQGEIEAGVEYRISHDLGVVPTRFMILDSRNTPLLVRTKSNNASFYLRNTALVSKFQGSVLIMP